MDVPILTEEAIARFRARLVRDGTTGCLVWQGAKTPRGYGKMNVGGLPKSGGRFLYAHRIAFALGGGTLTPQNPFVLHHCDNPSCCEFSHLYAGDQLRNMGDMARRHRGPRSKSGMPYGVTRFRGRFQATVYLAGGRRLHCGTFDTIEEAAAAAAKHRRGHADSSRMTSP